MNYSPRELTNLLHANPDLQIDGSLNCAKESTRRASTNAAYAQASITCEHDLQVAIIAECDRRALNDPLWRLIFAIPNGGHRNKVVAAKLRAEGLRAGVLDLFWPIARHGYHGMWMELKFGRNQPTDEQRDWIAEMVKQGYWVKVIHKSVDAAMKSFEWYLRGSQQ